ncbi:uncharacterized CRM domain-containing protein At3g25440, chloroplastic isoform X2 [Humulus lupulus]|uniref:uncharacterized CRM domain-containing protein At3g25440, chloroplastic isoform X2 n=1 Tax=Humulus lupulus TaxID=3486 RepID=UPI002B406ECE|nr:uncharacterized CRM domain-containing protein At3g25440, chloroplastic isoform X2 [Humulus lupulus]
MLPSLSISIKALGRSVSKAQSLLTRRRLTTSSSSSSSLFKNTCFTFAHSHTYHSSGSRCSRYMMMSSATSLELNFHSDVVRFSLTDNSMNNKQQQQQQPKFKRRKMSKKAKINQLKFYRLKARKKINSPNPEVRIRYKLEKAKRKEVWLIDKLRKMELPKTPHETEPHDPEALTEEEKHYIKRTGEKKKNYVPVGRRGVFGGVVLNMHLHWKKHETVKVVCRPCKPDQLHEYAQDLARLSKGIIIDIKHDNTILFYRGKNYVQPTVMSPPHTLSKDKALEKYKFLQSLEHTSQFIEKLEKELEEYLKHLARYKQGKEDAQKDSMEFQQESIPRSAHRPTKYAQPKQVSKPQ